MTWRFEADPTEVVVGLTPERWDVVLIVLAVVLFTCGYLVMVRS